MYSYTYDEETGGLLLNSSPLTFSKEPRPVYYQEMDVLGFDKRWIYAKNDSYPYMWAEANNYFYRGKLVAKTKGGKLYTAPEVTFLEDPEPAGEQLRFVDIPAMVQKNTEIMESLSQQTIKDVYNTYLKFRKKVDIFHVSFSGGKDSIVTLDIVQKAIPHNEFVVIFGNTQMEFPDTYALVEKIKNWCEEESISFYVAKSAMCPSESWRIFGPPSTTIRWCCSVHKTAPQLLLLREIVGKEDIREMSFVGIRGDESIRRSGYEYVSLGIKHKGQYSCNPILEWNSAEVYLYIYANNLFINDTYKKGNSRAGCLICPMASGISEYFRNINYPTETESFISIVREKCARSFLDKNDANSYIINGGWKQRNNGRDIKSVPMKYREHTQGNVFLIEIYEFTTQWTEWIKTIGKITASGDNSYFIESPFGSCKFNVEAITEVTKFVFTQDVVHQSPALIKMLKQVFRKSAYCVHCKECQADCPHGNLKMDESGIHVSDTCIHCGNCHKPDTGCLLYKSLVQPKGNGTMNTSKSLDCYADHAPKIEWIKSFFKLKDSFLTKHTLGSMMFSMFKRFLRDAELLNDDRFSPTAKILENVGLDSSIFWSILLVNLSYTPEIGWYVKNVPFDERVTRECLIELLKNEDVKERGAKSITGAFKRFLTLPFGKSAGLGKILEENGKYIGLMRGHWQSPEPRVILYALFKFAEACKDYYQFTLTRLLDHDIESDGVSPTQIFGLDRETMEKILNGLAVNYPEFITVSFNLDLDNITLRNDKTSADVLKLF